MTRAPGRGVTLAVHRVGYGRPTLVLHGGGPGCTSLSDFAAVAGLVGAGRELIFVDLAQFGRSDAPGIDGGLFDFHARSVTALLDGLRLAGTDVLAQSLGGSVALLLAARRPDLVHRIVASAPPAVRAPGNVRTACPRIPGRWSMKRTAVRKTAVGLGSLAAVSVILWRSPVGAGIRRRWSTVVRMEKRP